MFKQIQEIANGVKHYIITQEAVEKIAEERTTICQKCPLMSLNVLKDSKNVKLSIADKASLVTTKLKQESLGDHCTACGCFLKLKTRSLKSKCPYDKWDSIIDDKSVLTVTEE